MHPNTTQQNRKAATAVIGYPSPDRYGIGLAHEGTVGYTPWKGFHAMDFATYDEAKKEADFINAEILHLEPKEAYEIVAGTMRCGVRQSSGMVP